MGVNIGDVIVEPHASGALASILRARPERVAGPHGICISSAAYDQVEGKLRITNPPSKECSMSGERWPYFAGVASIILAIFFAYLVERKCQIDLAFQRSFPSALSELIIGTEPIRCWFSN
jgi:hypothetical protein